jgi:prepilin-type processing-associated H-X9-DG protein
VPTDAQQHGGGVAGGTGFHRATPPVAKGRKWRAEGDNFVIVDGSVTMGLPQGRFTHRSVTAFFDGHAAAMQPTELDNMALWFSKAQSVDDDYFN